jgi:hypothetical protein
MVSFKDYLCSPSGNHPKNKLTKIGYILNKKEEKI